MHHEAAPPQSLNRIAFRTTLHCLSGCAVGEVLGMIIGTAAGWADLPTIALSVALAFFFGYAFTFVPLLKEMSLAAAVKVALAADTLSITIMEIVDNAIMLAIPGAMDAHLDQPLFWGALAFALLVAGLAAFPVNRWLVSRGVGHAHHH